MNIKRLILLLVLFLIICAGSAMYFRWSSERSQVTDFYTSSTELPIANLEDRKDCAIIRRENIMLVIKGNSTDIKMSELEKLLPERISGLKKFNIIVTKDTEYSDFVTLLKVVSAARISKYAVVKM